ncbi:MAG: DUF2784 domain-containing protein [Desulforhopalus sp.]
MDSSRYYVLSADVVLLLHLFFASFVVIGLLCIPLGKFCRWSWVRNPVFRITHMTAIGVVALQAWLGLNCPLTILEKMLRVQAGAAAYRGSFISHILESILYYRLPDWVFALCYSVVFVAAVAFWIWVRPRPMMKSRQEEPR